MKKLLGILIILFVVTGCFNTGNTNNNSGNKEPMEKISIDKESRSEDNMESIISINVIINGNRYVLKLEDNETAQIFANKFSQEFNMSELNGNEKYVYLDVNLPTNASNPKHIEAGDVMLYGSNCLVIFYKSFDTNYSYTKIGHIDNLPNLGNSNITVNFEK